MFDIIKTVYFVAEYNQLSHRKYVDIERFTFFIRKKGEIFVRDWLEDFLIFYLSKAAIGCWAIRRRADQI